MPQEFLTFQKFNNIESANALADFLLENNIACEIEDERNYYDISYSFNKHDFDIKVKIASENFNKAHQIIENYYAKDLNNIEADYYLLQFTNDELKDIIKKPDEWGHFDYLLAKKLLIDKGGDIDEKKFDEYKNQRIIEKAKPAKKPELWIILGYIFSLLSLFSIISIFTGMALVISFTLAFLKKTLFDGKSVYYYDNNVRKHGHIILALVITGIVFWIYFFLVTLLNR
jgi:hypothetical protein